MGFYADVEANCKVYHTCDDHGNKFSYRCPEETAFRQDALICDHVHLVDCRAITYLSAQFQNGNADEENVHTMHLTSSPNVSVDSLDNHRHSFSRSFRVIQQPDKVKSEINKAQSGFVFSASLFLRDKIQNQTKQITDTCTTCNNSKNRMTISTPRSLTEQINSWNSRNDKSIPPRQSLPLSSSETRAFARDKSTAYRSFDSIANSSLVKMISEVNQPLSVLHKKSSSLNYNNDYHPYSETLRSIQANTHTLNIKSTTEIPALIHALTLSLKPLVPNELEYDPYYPKQPTSTEAYYTPSNSNKVNSISLSNQTPPIIVHPNFFEIPSVLPDLNTLEDLVDRRKFLYIPRANIKSIHR